MKKINRRASTIGSWFFPIVDEINYTSLIWCIGLTFLLHPSARVQENLFSIWGILLSLLLLVTFGRAITQKWFNKYEKLGMMFVYYTTLAIIVFVSFIGQITSTAPPTSSLNIFTLFLAVVYMFGLFMRVVITASLIHSGQPDDQALLAGRFSERKHPLYEFLIIFVIATLTGLILQRYYESVSTLMFITFAVTGVAYKALFDLKTK